MKDAPSMGGTSPPTQDNGTFQYMRDSRRWLLWKAIPNPSKSKPDKVPYYVSGKARGATDTPEDWAQLTTYDEACRVLSVGGYMGLAFALGPDGAGGYWQGVDLDSVKANELDDLADSAPGHVELSPSGNGCHAIGYGAYFPPLGSNETGVEAYASGRYFTFTGRCIRDGALTCLAAWVEGPLAARHNAARPTSGAMETMHVDAKTVTELRSALFSMRADDRDLWIRMGQALKELGDTGRTLWIDWSQTSDKWKPADAKKWDSFKGDRTGLGAVFAEAQRGVWTNPNSNEAQLNPNPAIEWNADALFAELSFDWSSTEPLPPDLIEGLVADEEVTILGGHGGIGKGFLSLQMACAVSLGSEVLGHRVPQGKRVLYYSAEDGRKRIGHRLRRLLESYDEEEKELVKQNLRLIDASDLDPLGGGSSQHGLVPLPDYEKLRKMVEAFDPQLVVIDGASDTFDGNEIARRDVRGFVKLLRRIHPRRRIGVLLIVHIDRASARGHVTNDDGYAGSTQWHNSARRRLYLQRFVEKDPDTKEETGETIFLRVMKNQDGPPAPDMEVVRQLSGFWQPAPHFVGNLAQPAEDYSETILALINEYYERGMYMSTSLAANATTGVFDTLRGDQKFPRSLSKKKTAELLRDLERNGELRREDYRRPAGGKAERWRVASSPSFNLPAETDVQSVPSEG